MKKACRRGSTGARNSASGLPPPDFRSLVPAESEAMGNLRVREEVIGHMRKPMPRIVCTMLLARLKEGRVFSASGRATQAGDSGDESGAGRIAPCVVGRGA